MSGSRAKAVIMSRLNDWRDQLVPQNEVEHRIPFASRAIVDILRWRGHDVVIRKTKYGNLRYSVDGDPQVTAYGLAQRYGNELRNIIAGNWGEEEPAGMHLLPVVASASSAQMHRSH